MKILISIFLLMVLTIALALAGKEATERGMRNPKEILYGRVIEVTFPPLDVELATWYDYDLATKNQKCRRDDCYSKYNATCASRDYPKGTILLVRNINNQKETTCRVNDYGPEEWTGKDLDLSSYAFKKLAPLSLGVIDVLFYEI